MKNFAILPFRAIKNGTVFRFEKQWFRRTVVGSIPCDSDGFYFEKNFNDRLESKQDFSNSTLVAVENIDWNVLDRNSIIEHIEV